MREEKGVKEEGTEKLFVKMFILVYRLWVVFAFNIVLFYRSLIFFLHGACIIRKTITKLFLINKSFVAG